MLAELDVAVTEKNKIFLFFQRNLCVEGREGKEERMGGQRTTGGTAEDRKRRGRKGNKAEQ